MQAIQRKGEVRTVTDLILKRTASDEFQMLRERGLLELSFEAIAMARSDHFANDVVARARGRLQDANVDLGRVQAYWRDLHASPG